jgi:hypothetical protein
MFRTHNDVAVNAAGTHLQGKLVADYDSLVKLFGQPITEGLDKSDAEWEIRFDDGDIATVYNWKNGKNYCGDQGVEVGQIREWNVGGRDLDSYYKIWDLIGK